MARSDGHRASRLPDSGRLCVSRYGRGCRYCYENYRDAQNALMAWDGEGDPPGPWIKEKPSGRLGPGATTS